MSRKALTCLSSCLARTAVEGVVRSHGNVWWGLAASHDGDYAKQTAKQERELSRRSRRFAIVNCMPWCRQLSSFQVLLNAMPDKKKKG